MKHFMKLGTLIMFSMVFCSLTSCKDHYGLEATDRGYLITNIPIEVMKEFKDKEEIKISLDDSDFGQTTITGIGHKEGANSFVIETTEKLRFSPVIDRTWLLMWFGDSNGVRDNCSGCSRDSTLKTYMNDHNMCYCTYSKVISK